MSEFELAMTRTEYDAAIKSLVVASKLAARYQGERDAALAALSRVREVTAALDRLYVKSADDAEVGYRGAGEYADAYEYATRLLHAALEPTP